MTQSLPSLLSDVISRLKSSKLSQPKILTGTVLVLLEVKVEIEIHVAIKVLLSPEGQANKLFLIFSFYHK